MINCMPLPLKQDTCNFTYLLFISVLASFITWPKHARGMTLVQYSLKFFNDVVTKRYILLKKSMVDSLLKEEKMDPKIAELLSVMTYLS